MSEDRRSVTEFIHEPYKIIRVRDIIRMNKDDLVNMISTLESSNAYWVDGALFVSFAITESEELAKKEIEGETILDKIIFTKYERYTKTVKSSDNIEVSVLNVQTSRLYKDLIAWLKKQPIWND